MSFTFKKYLLAVTAFALISPAIAGDTWISLGAGPSDSGGGTSLAWGLRNKPDSNWGFALGAVFNSEFGNKDILNYPVPHTNYTNLGTKRTGTTFGVDALYFINSSSSVRPYAGVGVYYAPRKEVAQSNATGWYYAQSDKSSALLAGEIGAQFGGDGKYFFGVGYHSIRGANVSLGWKF